MTSPEALPILAPEDEDEQASALASGDPAQCYGLAGRVAGVDIPALQEALLAAGGPRWAFTFALQVPGAEVLPLASFIAHQGGPSELLRNMAGRFPAVLTPEVLADLSLGVVF